MQDSRLFVPLKLVSYLVLLTILAAIGYAVAISLTHWSGIAV